MGYKRPVYLLQFADEQFAGLEVRMRGLTIERFVRLQAVLGRGPGLLDDTPEASAARGELYETLAAGLISWNLEADDDTPVPATAEALEAQDWALVGNLANAWLSAVAGVPAPLDRPSPNGEPSAEPSIPMEVLPPSPSS